MLATRCLFRRDFCTLRMPCPILVGNCEHWCFQQIWSFHRQTSSAIKNTYSLFCMITSGAASIFAMMRRSMHHSCGMSSAFLLKMMSIQIPI